MKHPDNKERYSYLSNRWKNGEATKTEETELVDWLNAHEMQLEVPGHFSASEADLQKEIYGNISRAIAKKPKKLRLWWRGIAAAAVLLIAFSALFLYLNQEPATLLTYQHNIRPGHNSATLTLANGKKIKLSDQVSGEIIKEAGVFISKDRDGKLVYSIGNAYSAPGDAPRFNTLATSTGETYQVHLPDGTDVWLNAGSSLKYPANFALGTERRVSLSGEAYFEIAKNKDRPFFVTTDKQEIKVLGTHFNVSSYEDEAITKTTLLEGSVGLRALNREETIVLKPGQQAILSSKSLTLSHTDAEKSIAWKNGKFEFVSEDIGSILRQIARWYDVEIVYKDELLNRQFSGSFSKFDDVAKVLRTIELTNDVHFKIEGRRILVMK
jgi:ferric-dicitrate binding protein FerR (iron transport regulator)